MAELGSFSFPELASWSHLHLRVISAENPIKKTVKPKDSIKILTTDIGGNSFSLPIATGKITLAVNPRRTVLSRQFDQAAILSETHATFCYLILTLAPDGRAAMIHDHFWEIEEKIKNYRQFLRQNLAGQSLLTFVGGLNGGEEANVIQQEYINEKLKDISNVYRLLISPEGELKVFPASQIGKKGLGPGGLISLPTELSTNNQPTILAVMPGFEASFAAENELINPVTWQ